MKSTMNPNQHFIVVGNFSLHGRAAGSIRATHLATALSRESDRVTMIAMGPQDLINGCPVVKFNQCQDSSFKVIRTNKREIGQKVTLRFKLKNYIATRLLTFRSLIGIFRQGQTSVLLFNSTAFDALSILILTRFFGGHVYQELCEWFPVHYYRKSAFRGLFSDLFLREVITRLADGVICISSFISERMVKRSVRNIIVPSMVNPKLADFSNRGDCNLCVGFPAQPRSVGAPFRVAYAGKMKAHDGFWLLLDAVRLLVKRKFNVQLRISGDASQLVGLEDSKLDRCGQEFWHSVRVYGWQSREDYLTFLRNSDCLVLPRPSCQINMANFPTRMPEAMCIGLPLIIGNCGEVQRHIKDGESALLLSDQPSPSEIADAIEWLGRDERLRARLSRQSRQLAQDSFAVEQYSRKLYEFLSP